MRSAVVCLLVAAAAAACIPNRGVRLEHSQTSSDRRPSGDSLVEIDPHSGSVVHVVPIADPGPVIVSGPSVWVASPRRSTVSRVDARSSKLVATTRLAATPVAVAPGPAGSVWVLLSGTSPAVVQLAAKSGRIVKRFALAPCCPGPRTIASTPGAIWIAGREGVLRIDPKTGARSIVAPHLRAVAIAPAPDGRVFVSNGWDAVTPLPRGGQPTIKVRYETAAEARPHIEPTGLVFVDGTLWVVSNAKRGVFALDQYAMNTGYSNAAAVIPVGRAPDDVAYGEGSLWVDSRGDGTISQVDPTTERVIRTIHLGYRPAGLAVGAGAVWASARRVNATAAATGLLAFDDHGQIYTSRPDGSHRRQLTHTRWPLQNIEPAWSPDGGRIAFVRIRGDKESFGYPFAPLSLYVMRADGSRPRSIPHTGDAFGGAPAWSPDGTRIAFDGGSPSFRIYTIGVDGAHRAQVPGVPVRSSDPTWSPDGTKIGFDSNAYTADSALYKVYAIRLNGTHLTRLANIPAAYLKWSPDGRRIVFNRNRSDGTYLGEFVAPTSGGPGARLLQPTNRYSGRLGPSVASWSPDGAAIAVSGVLDQFPNQPAIYIANSDGTGLTFVTRGNDATWSPVP